MGWLIFFGYFSVILLPPIGLILGSVLILKQRKGHGFAVVGLSIAVIAVAALVPVGDEEGGSGRSIEVQINSGGLHAYQNCLLRRGRIAPCGKFLPRNRQEQP